jgi:hypothetical protein
MALKNLLPVEYFDPVEEAIEHVHELAVYDDRATLGDIVDCAFDEIDCQEQAVTVEVLERVMHSVFGSRHEAKVNHFSYTGSELSVLYPGVTGQLLTWYVQSPDFETPRLDS